MNWIDDRLAVGDITDTTMRDALKKEGIEFIVDVRVHFDHVSNNMTPMPTLWKFVNDLLDLTEKAKVMIHCHGGIDRSPFTAMLYYKLKHGCDYDEAYKVICKQRPQTIVHDEWIKAMQKPKTKEDEEIDYLVKNGFLTPHDEVYWGAKLALEKARQRAGLVG
jgi:protein-tyrosine phosphatase